jgi:hypothetical protein
MYNITSIEGFVQQLAVGCVARGYWFYVDGLIPDHKDPAAVDAKLAARYGLDLSKWARARRKRSGGANVRYLRHGHFFVLLATHGRHAFFDVEPFRDIRERPIRFAGYSIGCGRGTDGRWHASVRIHPEQYRRLKAHLLDLAIRRKAESLTTVFRQIPYAPYAPVRRQLLDLLRAVNRERRRAGFEDVPVTALRLRRRPVRIHDFADFRPLSPA